MIEADHWSKVEGWPSRHFSPQEMACRHCGRLKIDPKLLDNLETLRATLGGKPMVITSGYRCPEHNRRVGGAPKSQHMEGRAADVMQTNHDPHRFKAVAEGIGFTGIGTYPASNFIHVDVRPNGPARWGRPFSGEAQAFTPEPPKRPVRQAAKEGGVTIGGVAAVHEGAQQVMTQAAPFLPSEWLTYAALGVAALGLIVVAVRAFKKGDD
jgi:hypothetical protein